MYIKIIFFNLLIIFFIAGMRIMGVSMGIIAMKTAQMKSHKFGLIEALVFLEPPLFFIATLFTCLFSVLNPMDFQSLADLILSYIGVFLAIAGIITKLFAVSKFPSIHIGHSIQAEQKFVASGVFYYVRHPLYLGLFMIYAAFAIAFKSLIITVLFAYVLIVYYFYSKAEESMMLEEYGSAYKKYMEKTPMFLPMNPFSNNRRIDDEKT